MTHNYAAILLRLGDEWSGCVMKDMVDGHLLIGLTAGDKTASWTLSKADAQHLAHMLAGEYLRDPSVTHLAQENTQPTEIKAEFEPKAADF